MVMLKSEIETKLSLSLITKLNDEGKNSEAFLMHDPQLDAKFVVKKIPKTDFKSEEDYFKESKMLYYVKHPNITKIQHSTSDQNYIYLSMPYYENGSLNSILDFKYLNVKEIIQISLDFLTGLHYIHTKGLIHYDIKPSNILLNKNKRALITDFGLSKYINKHGLATQGKAYCSHRAPEQLFSSNTNNKTDIYQAGVTLFRMCNGNEYFYKLLKCYNSVPELYEAIKSGDFPSRDSFLPHIPFKLKKVVKTALSTNIDERWDTVLEMINEIAKVEKNIGWVYNKVNQNNMEWITENTRGTHFEKIILKKDNNIWNILGKKIRKKDGYTQNMLNRTVKGIKSKENAFDKIYKLIRDSN